MQLLSLTSFYLHILDMLLHTFLWHCTCCTRKNDAIIIINAAGHVSISARCIIRASTASALEIRGSGYFTDTLSEIAGTERHAAFNLTRELARTANKIIIST